MSGRFVLNGRVICDKQSILFRGRPYEDLGSVRGLAVSEVMEARGRVIFRFTDHFERLSKSAEWTEGLIDLSKIEVIASGDLEKRLGDLTETNGFKESVIHLQCTAGEVDDDGWTPVGAPQLYAFVLPLKRKEGFLRLQTREFAKQFAGVKRPDYFYTARERFHVSRSDADGKIQYHDILCFGLEGEILEMSGSNICFVLKDRSVIAPPLFNKDGYQQVLDGVTLKVLFELIKKSGDMNLGVKREQIDIYFLNLLMNNLDGALATSTTGVIPIEKIDSLEIPVGPLTLQLQKMFEEYREDYYADHGVCASA